MIHRWTAWRKDIAWPRASMRRAASRSTTPRLAERSRCFHVSTSIPSSADLGMSLNPSALAALNKAYFSDHPDAEAVLDRLPALLASCRHSFHLVATLRPY